MLRVLVTVRPRMYREVLALCVNRNRLDLEVRAALPEATAEEVASFGPHLLVCDDTASVPEGGLEVVPCRVEMTYSESMDARDARLISDGRISEVREASVVDLLGAVDRARELLADREAASG